MRSIAKQQDLQKMPPKKELNSYPKRRSGSSDQREIAKAGMVSSLGTLFLTGFVKFKGARLLHTWAGWALLGFSIWHHILSAPKSKTLPEDK